FVLRQISQRQILTDLKSPNIGGNGPAILGRHLRFIIRHGTISLADDFKKVADRNVSQSNTDAAMLEAPGQIGDIIRRRSIAALHDLAVALAIESVANSAKDFKTLLSTL